MENEWSVREGKNRRRKHQAHSMRRNTFHAMKENVDGERELGMDRMERVKKENGGERNV